MKVDVAVVLELLPENLGDKHVVVIDVLRATTTIVAAMGAGTPYILPVESIEEARSLAAEYGHPEGCYLGGERHRLPPEGFDFGNSPEDYLQLPEEKPVIFTTTNGTRALKRVAGARSVWIGGLTNASALAKVLMDQEGETLLVCSGTLSRIAEEDVLAAGAIILEMQTLGPVELTDAARVAKAAYLQVADSLPDYLFETENGGKLREVGLAGDVLFAARLNSGDLAPRYLEGRIVP